MPIQNNRLSPPIDIETFNKQKVSEDFIKSCKVTGELFKQGKKEESQGRDLPPAQPQCY